MISNFQTCMRPILEAAINEPRKISDVIEEISNLFELTEEERSHLIPSGTQTTIANRIYWSWSLLKQAGLVRNFRRGWYELTNRGLDVVTDRSIELNVNYLTNFDEYNDFRMRANNSNKGVAVDADLVDAITTPDESLHDAHRQLDASLAANLLEATRQATQVFFEQLIVELFIAMGYGGTSEDAGRALGQSGDNGVDGAIDQDPLGVDQIYLQAKWYAATNKVGAGDIRDFFGALNIKKAQKGIFVTTSSFTPDAIQTAKTLGSRIVLIDGAQVATLLIRYNIGCREEKIIHIREFDDSYFDRDS